MTFWQSLHFKYRYRTLLGSSARVRGFTLLELLVVMGIMLLITTLILARHSQYNGTVLLRNLSYSVGLSIRQAQVYGLSGRSVGGAVATRFGVYFTAANPTQYVLFTDQNNNAAYDSGEDIEVFTLRAGYAISNLCANTGVVEKCSGLGDIDRLTILFTRPHPDARFVTNVTNDTYVDATVTLLSSQGATRQVTVTTTGQIAVQQD